MSGLNRSEPEADLGAGANISIRKIIANRVLPRHSPFLERLNWSARWVASVRESQPSPAFATREAMYDHLNAKYFGGGASPIDFLEFGVHLGGSLRHWCSLNANSESRFFGFDSFEGLPEDWNNGAKKGAYSANGRLPEIKDSRVQFVKGWFQDTLPAFLSAFQGRNRIVIHNDSDLYSSTLYCLTMLNFFMVPGTVVIFDEFYDPVNEYRALQDYAGAYRRKFELVAHTRGFTQATVELS